MNTFESVFEALTKLAQTQGAIDTNMLMQLCIKLNVLLQHPQEQLFELEQVIAERRKLLLEEGKTAAYVKMVIEAIPEYTEARKLKAKIDRAIEAIRGAKKLATLTAELMKTNL